MTGIDEERLREKCGIVGFILRRIGKEVCRWHWRRREDYSTEDNKGAGVGGENKRGGGNF